MSVPIHELPAVDPDSGRLNVVIDTPKGCRNKYKLDEHTGLWHLSKMLPQGMSFPCDFGFIPSTRGEDGDPVDVLVFMDEPAFLGALLPRAADRRARSRAISQRQIRPQRSLRRRHGNRVQPGRVPLTRRGQQTAAE